MENMFFSKDKFCARLKTLRGSRSQKEIANMLGLQQQKWQRIESGKNEPNLSLLVQMSIVLNVSIPSLLGIDDTQSELRSPSRYMDSQLTTLEKGAAEILASAQSYFENVKSARKEYEKLKMAVK